MLKKVLSKWRADRLCNETIQVMIQIVLPHNGKIEVYQLRWLRHVRIEIFNTEIKALAVMGQRW